MDGVFRFSRGREYRLVVVGDVDMRGQEEIEIAFVSPVEANLLRLLGVF